MTDTTDRVTPEQIEEKLRGLKADLEGRAQSAKETLVPVAVGVGLLLLLVAYLLGKRGGRKQSTVVEVRRL